MRFVVIFTLLAIIAATIAVLAGCASRQSDYWGGVSQGVGDTLGK